MISNKLKNKLRDFLDSLGGEISISTDPFDDDYFDLTEYERRRIESEPRLAEDAILQGRDRAIKNEIESKAAIRRESAEKPNKWSGYQ